MDFSARRSLLSSVLLPILLLAMLSGCSAMRKAEYGVQELFGREKRHILADAVEDTQEEQAKATEQFADVLTQIKALYGYEGGELEKLYRRLEGGYEDSVARADEVRERIDRVETVAGDLWAEWESEIEQIQNVNLRSQSRQTLRETQQRYQQMHAAMQSAESRMDPVLQSLSDYVLFLKHNLNARALGSLEGEVGAIESSVEALIEEMNSAIEEAETFLETMPS